MGSKAGLIDRLEAEHHGIREAVWAVVTARPDARARALHTLVRSIAQHEVAEEVVVYPAAQRLGVTHQLILDARVAEHASLDHALERLRREDVDSASFEMLLRDVARQVDVHTRYEEKTVLEPLRERMSEEHLAELGAAYERTRVAAPVYPYPGSPRFGDEGHGRALTVRGALLTFLRRIRDHHAGSPAILVRAVPGHIRREATRDGAPHS